VAGDRIGSRLWLLSREKETKATLSRAEEYGREALGWLIEDRVAERIEVTAKIPRTGVLGLEVVIYRPQADPVRYRFDHVWAALEGLGADAQAFQLPEPIGDPDILLGNNAARVAADIASLAKRCTYQVAASENYLNGDESVVFLNDPHVATPDVQFTGIDSANYPSADGYYTNLVAQLHAVTDLEYLQEELQVPTDGHVTFTTPFVAGAKVVRLVDTATGRTKCYAAENIGRLRSYDFPLADPAYEQFRNRGYTYDQAVYICVLAAAGNEDVLLDRAAVGLIQCQLPSGAWPFSVNILSAVGDPYVRNGAVAWCLYALARYVHHRGAGADPTALEAIEAAADYLLTQVSAAGLQTGSITGGTGRYVDDVFDDGYVIPWASTEHNLDAYFALRWAGEVTGTAAYSTAADEIAANLMAHHWNAAGRYFYQGISDAATIDTGSALDCLTWGAYFLFATARIAEARSSMARADDVYRHTISGLAGFAPYEPADGYPDAIPTIWCEGTLGAAAGFFRLGDFRSFQRDVNAIDRLRTPDNLLPYATVPVPAYEIVDYPAAIGIAWDALVRLDPAGIFSLPVAG
jgi:hypothetical protein